MIGQTLGHYRVLEQIGAGGMGVVYLARDERLDRDVALKVLPQSLLTDAAALKSFRKEAHALSKLNHPNIATVHDFDAQDGVNFLVMEYIPGVTLDQMLTGGPLNEKEVVRLGVQLAQGLRAAHSERLIHRDLKPSNLRITPDGRLKILDFGLAKLARPSHPDVTESLTAPHQMVGTLPYMSPEQLQGEPADERSDIYSSGAVLYEMSTGRRPFPDTYAPLLIDSIVHKPPQPPSAINRNISTALENAILKCLDKDPEHRYQSAKELQIDLERSGPIYLPPPQKGRSRRLAAVSVLILLASMAIAVKRLGPPLHDVLFPRYAVPEGVPSSKDGDYLAVLINTKNHALEPAAEQLAKGVAVKLMTLKELSVASPKGTKRALDPQDPQFVYLQWPGCASLPAGSGKTACKLYVNQIVGGTLEGDAKGRIDIDVSVENIGTGKRKSIGKFSGTVAGHSTLEDKIYERLVDHALRTNLPSEEFVQPMAPPVYDAESDQLYDRGREALKNESDITSLKVAIDSFTAATNKNPKLARAYVGEAQADWAMWKATTEQIYLTNAIVAAQQAQNWNQNLTADEHLALAYVFLEKNSSTNTDSARRQLKYALPSEPNNAEIWRLLGKVALRSGERKASVVFDYINATHIAPDYARNWDELGTAYLKFGEYRKAVEAFKKMIDLDPQSPEGHRQLGIAYAHQALYTDFLTEEQTAVALCENPRAPENPDSDIYVSRGVAYFWNRMYVEAVADYKKSLELDPENHLAMGNLADAYSEAGDKKRAGEAYKNAIRLSNDELALNPDDPYALADEARFYAKQGQVDQATYSINQAYKKDQYNVEIMYMAAQVYALTGNKAESIKRLLLALDNGFSAEGVKLDPDFKDVKDTPSFSNLLAQYQGKDN